jgi:hypothetical protein
MKGGPDAGDGDFVAGEISELSGGLARELASLLHVGQVQRCWLASGGVSIALTVYEMRD